MAEALAKKMNLPIYYEPVTDNIYLEDFYGDMQKYSFPLQIYLLNKRFKQQQQIVWLVGRRHTARCVYIFHLWYLYRGGKGGVQDRTIYEDCVFAKMLKDGGLMDERDYGTYIELFQNMSNFMKKPNIIVHLDLSPDEAMERIKLRARGCEVGITLEYLQGLHKAYDEFIQEIAKTVPVIKVDYSSFRTIDEMTRRIMDEYEKIANIRVVEW